MAYAKQTWTALRCDECGRFVAYADLNAGRASHRLITPDSAYTYEEYETLCPTHTWPAAQEVPHD